MKTLLQPFVTVIAALAFSVMLVVDNAAASTLHRGPLLRLVALTGSQPVGLPADQRLQRLYHASINDRGNVAFSADTWRGATSQAYRQSIWGEMDDGSLRLVAETGHVAPQLPDHRFSWFPYQPLAITSDGRVAFEAKLDNEHSHHYGLWLSNQEGRPELAIQWDFIDELPPAARNFSAVNELRLNDSGQLAFWGAKWSSGSYGGGLWRKKPGGEPEIIVSSGDDAPGLSGGKFWNFRALEISRSGKIAFRGNVTRSAGSDPSLVDGIFVEGDDGLVLVAAVGQQVPGAEPGVVFTDLDGYAPVTGNNHGEVAFSARVSPSWAESPYRSGIWLRNRQGDLSPVVRLQDSAPGTDGATFGQVSQIALDDDGRISFLAGLKGPAINNGNDTGIWQRTSDGSEIVKVAQQGDAAPGGGQFALFGWLAVNNAGRVAFGAGLSGPGLDPAIDSGVWAFDRNGVLVPVVRTGDFVDLGDGSVREVANAWTNGGRPGNVNFNSFNDRGEIAVQVTFTDGSQGIFVSRSVAVPEPGAWALMVAGLVLAAARLRGGRRSVRSRRGR
jgi:hypothetical protein